MGRKKPETLLEEEIRGKLHEHDLPADLVHVIKQGDALKLEVEIHFDDSGEPDMEEAKAGILAALKEYGYYERFATIEVYSIQID